jgi:hypothetical protein
MNNFVSVDYLDRSISKRCIKHCYICGRRKVIHEPVYMKCGSVVCGDCLEKPTTWGHLIVSTIEKE